MTYHACYKTEEGTACTTVEAQNRAEAVSVLMVEIEELKLHPSKIRNVTQLR